MPLLKTIFFIALFGLFDKVTIAQNKPICVLDLTKMNSESTAGNLYSVSHILKSAGFSFNTTEIVSEALRAKVIITTSNIEPFTFIDSEKDSLQKFVERGGVLISTNCKDSYFNSLFGISASSFSNARMVLNFNTNDNPTLFKLFDDPYEKQIHFANPLSSALSIGTRAYSLNNASSLANYETGETAITHNNYFLGHTYLFGAQFRDVILRPQVKQDYGASRAYSNSFEPGQDVYVFLIAAIIKNHLPNVVYKHTAPRNYKAALTITHDVDATTSMDFFDDYANYEKINNISSTYLVTTHYVHDKIAKNFFDGYQDDIIKVFDMGHDIQSHSVSHVPDFDDKTIVPMGVKGNTRNSYQPYYNGDYSTNVTVLGEIEVSHNLLSELIHKPITFFRPGYLAFNPKLINALDSLKVPFSASHSANNVMTNFPFYSYTDLSMTGRQTNILEIPNSISDVFVDDLMSEDNFMDKVDSWKRNFSKVYNNNLSSVLLIHPTRYYKLFAQQLFVNSLPSDVIINNLSQYGAFWNNRNDIEFTSIETNNTLTIYLSVNADNINPDVSFIVNNGSKYSTVKIYSLDNQLLDFEKSAWEVNSVIMHWHSERPNYNVYSINLEPSVKNIFVYPNPSTKDDASLHFELMEESEVVIDIVDLQGKVIRKSFYSHTLNLGVYDVKLPNSLTNGMYIVNALINNKAYKLKWINDN